MVTSITSDMSIFLPMIGLSDAIVRTRTAQLVDGGVPCLGVVPLALVVSNASISVDSSIFNLTLQPRHHPYATAQAQFDSASGRYVIRTLVDVGAGEEVC